MYDAPVNLLQTTELYLLGKLVNRRKGTPREKLFKERRLLEASLAPEKTSQHRER
jgi:hypothetical protein